MEIWKPVTSWESLYEVSDRGAVRRSGRNLVCYDRGNGYSTVMLTEGKRRVIRSVHSLVAEAFIGERPADRKHINHIDGVKTNNHVDNLEYVTPKENSHHAYRLGLKVGRKGEAHSQATLTNDKVYLIRDFAARGISHQQIADFLGIQRRNVSRVASKQRWAHV